MHNTWWLNYMKMSEWLWFYSSTVHRHHYTAVRWTKLSHRKTSPIGRPLHPSLCIETDLHNGSTELFLNTLTQALHPPRTLQHRSLCPLPELTILQITVWELPGDREQFINTASLQRAKFNNTFPTTCLWCRSMLDYSTECPTVSEIDVHSSVTKITRMRTTWLWRWISQKIMKNLNK